VSVPAENSICTIRDDFEVTDLPKDETFFEPYLQYYVKEILDIGGEAYSSRTLDGKISGLFIYDRSEKSGTIFTRSREAFDLFYELRPFNFLFAELNTEHENEPYDIYKVEFGNTFIEHRFGHEISVAKRENMGEVKQFMISAHPGINGKWVEVALKDGERCFLVKLEDQIAGLAWASLVNRVGRLHSLYVNPQFRGLGIGEDLLRARLLWLRSNRARFAFSEISRFNAPSAKIATRAGMMVSGQIFQYFRKTLPGSPALKI
jgi:GNAT superfamily N-acetyltransferase